MLTESNARIVLIERLMSQLMAAENRGGFTSIYAIVDILKDMLAGLPMDAVIAKKPDFVAGALIEELFQANIVAADLQLVLQRRNDCRRFIRESLILILENSQRHITVFTAKEIFLSLHGGNFAQDYLAAADKKTLLAMKVLNVDTDWVFNIGFLTSLQALLDNSIYSVRGSYDYLDTLPGKLQQNLYHVLHAHLQFMYDQTRTLAYQKLSLDEIFDDIERLFQQAPTRHIVLHTENYTDFSPAILHTFMTLKVKIDLQKRMMSLRFAELSSRFLNTVAQQNADIAQAIQERFNEFSNCVVYQSCGQPQPVTLTLREKKRTQNETVRENARRLLDSNIMTIHNQAQFRFNESFLAPRLLSLNDTLYYANAQPLADYSQLSGTFDPAVQDEINYVTQWTEIDDTFDSFRRHVWENPLEGGKQLITAFDCFVAYTIANNQSLCQTMWQGVANLTYSNNLRQLPVLVEQVTGPLHSPLAQLPTLELPSTPWLMATSLGLTCAGLGYLAHRFGVFGRKNANVVTLAAVVVDGPVDTDTLLNKGR